MRQDSDNLIRLSKIETFSSPFDYFISTEALRPDAANDVLHWLETTAAWKLVETDFYEQYEFSFWNVERPPPLMFLTERELVTRLRNRIGGLFNARLSDRVDIAAHKLVSGQRIRLHNDFIPGQETHRLLIQLNRGWTDDNGGLLVLFNSSEPGDIHKVFRPTHNTALAFAVSPRSNHAVSTVHAEQRFTLVYSFFDEQTNV